MPDNDQSAELLIDQLLQSHAELSAALRLAGRQILRYAPKDDAALERIRKVLKRADRVRQAIAGPADLEEVLTAGDRASMLGSDQPQGEQLSSDFAPELSIVENR